MELSQKHKVFAEAVIEGLSPTDAYFRAYATENKETCRSRGHKLSQNVTVAAYIKEKSHKIEELATNKAVEELKDKIVRVALTVEERKQILEDIALGKTQYKTYEVIQTDEETPDGMPIFGTRPITVSEPSLDHRVKAIAELNRMGGDYAATKTTVTINKIGKDLDEEIFE